MAHPDLLAEYFADGIFFAPPASPWLRGTNENTNGPLRQYFPKGSDLRRFTADDLRAVEQRLKERPRKRLGWRSPSHVFESELAESNSSALRRPRESAVELARRQGIRFQASSTPSSARLGSTRRDRPRRCAAP